MSVREKVELACRYPASFPYKYDASSAYGMFYNECGKNNKYQKIATVAGTSFTQKKLKKGVVVAKKPGTCTVYAYAQNGVSRAVTVKVS